MAGVTSNGNGGIWKTVALALVTFLTGIALVGIPLLRAPTGEEVEEIQDQQVLILTRLATIDSQLAAIMQTGGDAKEKSERLEELIREHILNDGDTTPP